jgi:hypothetical protein
MHIVTFSALADFPALLGAHLHSFPAGTVTDNAPTTPIMPDRFVDHLLDFEMLVFHRNLQRILEEDKPHLSMGFDQPDHQDAATGGDADVPDAALKTFHEARKRTLSILESLDEAQWQRAGVIDDAQITAIGLVHLLCAHDLEQLAALQHALAINNAP